MSATGSGPSYATGPTPHLTSELDDSSERTSTCCSSEERLTSDMIRRLLQPSSLKATKEDFRAELFELKMALVDLLGQVDRCETEASFYKTRIIMLNNDISRLKLQVLRRESKRSQRRRAGANGGPLTSAKAVACQTLDEEGRLAKQREEEKHAAKQVKEEARHAQIADESIFTAFDHGTKVVLYDRIRAHFDAHPEAKQSPRFIGLFPRLSQHNEGPPPSEASLSSSQFQTTSPSATIQFQPSVPQPPPITQPFLVPYYIPPLPPSASEYLYPFNTPSASQLIQSNQPLFHPPPFPYIQTASYPHSYPYFTQDPKS
ncbi:hypothetical protein AMATHDRAFT_88780 [Amanita thiersii Skay4041]|uniref:Uncharacterized protein n=1 Tax=Amanita thiersii Skay4041 TaxID=703135 RepID=A0A2A9N7M2_9AGAR|nr:hypothetical protein AMATHDRAFT_88780 [Amanita thiersii Skay4041]